MGLIDRFNAIFSGKQEAAWHEMPNKLASIAEWDLKYHESEMALTDEITAHAATIWTMDNVREGHESNLTAHANGWEATKQELAAKQATIDKALRNLATMDNALLAEKAACHELKTECDKALMEIGMQISDVVGERRCRECQARVRESNQARTDREELVKELQLKRDAHNRTVERLKEEKHQHGLMDRQRTRQGQNH